MPLSGRVTKNILKELYKMDVQTKQNIAEMNLAQRWIFGVGLPRWVVWQKKKKRKKSILGSKLQIGFPEIT